MALQIRRALIAGGEAGVADADLADGKTVFCWYYTYVYDEWGDVVATVLTSQSATLNGCLVKDPKYAQKLLDEAMAQ